MSKLYDCFVTELAGIYDAEKQLTKALSEMAIAAQNDELKTALRSHQGKTEEHVRRAEKVFAVLGEKVIGRKCKAMQGLIVEAGERIDEDLGDAALVCAAQKIEHYEIATYGCLRSWAQLMDHDEAADLIEATLDDENDADEHLTSLAVQIINLDAGDAEEQEDMDIEHASKHEKSSND